MQISKDVPILSLIVVFSEMQRKAPQTLFTLSPEYQGLPPSLYEVIVVDSSSSQPLDDATVHGIAGNFHYTFSDPGARSPVEALNLGASLSRGQLMGFMIDGACMLSPGVLKYAVRAARAYKDPVVSTPGYHLGRAPQPAAVAVGYDQASEDLLLASVDWRRNGYELFRISSPAPSDANGGLAPSVESHCVFVTPRIFDAVGGFHRGFDMAGGGFANRDFYREVCEHPESDLVILLGEGTFRQFDGAASADKAPGTSEKASAQAERQYEAIRKRPYAAPTVGGDLVGSVPSSFIPVLGDALDTYARFQETHPEVANGLDSRHRPFDRPVHEDSTSRTIIILGMHRSGTSMLAGTLQEAGLKLGSVDRNNPYNRKGNRENWAVLHMQEDLLERSGGAWNDVPNAVQWHTVHRAVRDEFIAGFAGVKIWGFKDPRTIFTLDGWLEVLPDAECVGIFRHPMLVANSLHRRDGFTIEHGLALWHRYNKKLLKIHRARPFLLIEFDDDPVRLKEKLRQLSQRLDLPWRFRAPHFFDDKLRHRLDPTDRVPDDILKTYEELKSLESSTRESSD